jgi:hypothetical protein
LNEEKLEIVQKERGRVEPSRLDVTEYSKYHTEVNMLLTFTYKYAGNLVPRVTNPLSLKCASSFFHDIISIRYTDLVAEGRWDFTFGTIGNVVSHTSHVPRSYPGDRLKLASDPGSDMSGFRMHYELWSEIYFKCSLQ